MVVEGGLRHMSVPGGALRVKVEGSGVGRGAWVGERLSCWYVIGGLCGRVYGGSLG